MVIMVMITESLKLSLTTGVVDRGGVDVDPISWGEEGLAVGQIPCSVVVELGV